MQRKEYAPYEQYLAKEVMKIETSSRSILSLMHPESNNLSLTFDIHVLREWLFPFYYNNTTDTLAEKLAGLMCTDKGSQESVEVYFLKPAFQDLLHRFFRISEGAERLASDSQSFDKVKNALDKLTDINSISYTETNSLGETQKNIKYAIRTIRELSTSQELVTAADKTEKLLIKNTRVISDIESSPIPKHLLGVHDTILDEMWHKRPDNRPEELKDFNYRVDAALIVSTIHINNINGLSSNLITEGHTYTIAGNRALTPDAGLILLSSDHFSENDYDRFGPVKKCLKDLYTGAASQRENAAAILSGRSIPGAQLQAFHLYVETYLGPLVELQPSSSGDDRQMNTRNFHEQFSTSEEFFDAAKERVEISTEQIMRIAEAGKFLLESKDHFDVKLSEEYKRMQKRFGLR